nr:ribonuclease H-like domain-containing protein [Tanacetum cinerariifolium]
MKQAPRQWNHKLSKALLEAGFVQSKNDHSLFIKNKGNVSLYLLAFVDDLVIIDKCLVTRRFVYGHCVFVNGNLVSWKSKKHATLFKSSAEAKYRMMQRKTNAKNKYSP